MVGLEDWTKPSKKEEINPMQKYPIIWKTTKCSMGECRSERTSHRWSIPCGTPEGMATECYDCHIARIVKTDSDPDLWMNKPKTSGMVFERLKELNSNEEKEIRDSGTSP